MSQIYMLTAPRAQVHKRAIKEFIEKHDIHRWIYAKETGKGGYEHWQIRLDTCATFEELKSAFPTAHIEKSTQWCDYERKEGNYVSSEDNDSILSVRYGKLRRNQKEIIRQVLQQSDRGVTVVFDPNGNTGKSWLVRYLYEKGRAFYVPPTVGSSQGIIQFVCSGYKREGIIVIDIPRTVQWSRQMYECIETIKDGLVYDTRYSAKMRDIYGVRVLVTTNTMPKLDNLSADRWTILNAEGKPLNEH